VTINYFAYGSNMAAEVMEGMCPRNRFLGVARLDGYRLAFTRRSIRTGTGVADVIPATNETVWGALYEIEDDELTAIDRKEGYGWAYTRVMCPVLLEAGGQGQAAVVYTVRVKEPVQVLPSRQYLDCLIAAARDRRLPKAYVEKLQTMVACC
jgi:gamma-glutamylcyclotransferase